MTNSTSSSELRRQQQQHEEDRDDDMKSTIQSMLPIRMVSKVVRGFGRGSSDLGIPTANLERSVLQLLSTSSSSSCGNRDSKIVLFDNLPCGIYWGFARIGDKKSNVVENKNGTNNPNPMGIAYKAAVSIGYNPTYGNGTLTHTCTQQHHHELHLSPAT